MKIILVAGLVYLQRFTCIEKLLAPSQRGFTKHQRKHHQHQNDSSIIDSFVYYMVRNNRKMHTFLSNKVAHTYARIMHLCVSLVTPNLLFNLYLTR